MMINHIMCTSKFLTHLCFRRQKTRIKNGSVKVVCSVFSKENELIKYKKDCLSINGK